MNLSNVEAEICLLGSVLEDRGTKEATDEILTSIKTDYFAEECHQHIFTAMRELHLKGIDIDIVTLTDNLERSGNMSAAGGLGYLTKLTNFVLSSSNYTHYLGIIRDLAQKRKLMRFSKYVEEQTETGKPAAELLSDFENCISKMALSGVKNDLQPISAAADKEYQRIIKASQGEYEPFGLRTGFDGLDRALWGLRRGAMYVLAARPGVGKTAFALNVLHHASIKGNKTCAFFSLEMPADQIAQRLYCIGGGLDTTTVLSGKGIENHIDDLNKVRTALSNGSLFIDDTCNITPQEVLAKAKKLQRQKGLDLIVIDYLQKMKPPRSLNNPVIETGETAKAIKDIARRLDVPVLAICQPNRQMERGRDGKAQEALMSDLRGSGEIEQEADVIGFLLTEDPREAEVKKVFLQLAKNRHGGMKNFEYEYTGCTFTFKETGNKTAPAQKKTFATLTPVQDQLPF